MFLKYFFSLCIHDLFLSLTILIPMLEKELGFIPIKDFLINFNLHITDTKILIKHFELPKITSFISKLTTKELIIKSILLINDKNNILCAGSIKNGNKNNSLEPLKIIKENTTINLLRMKHWNELFKIMGDELSIFILTKCFIIENINGKKVFLTGNINNLIYNNFDKNKSIDRSPMYISRLKVNQLKLNELFLDYEFFNMKKLELFINRFNKLNITAIFNSFFKEYLCINQEKIIENYSIPHKILIDFLFCISKRIFSGIISFYNFRILKSKITLLITKNKFENINFGLLKKYFKLIDNQLFTKFKKDRINIKKANNQFLEFIICIFKNIYIPIVAKYFFVTEASTTKLRLHYFPLIVWNQLTDCSVKKFLNNYTEVKPTNNSSSIKLIPKTKDSLKLNDFRVIIKVKKSWISQSIKHILHQETKDMLGNSILRYNDIQNILQNGNFNINDKLFLCKFDLKKCYDNLKHSKLELLINELINENKYLIKKYNIVEKVAGQTKIRFMRLVVKKQITFIELIKSLNLRNNQIIYESVYDEVLYRQNIITEIKSNLLDHVIKYRNKNYLQREGIPQGSVLSALICSLYLSKIDKEFLNEFLRKGKMIRYIDDFLIITPEKNEIFKIVDKICELKNYGLIFNISKYENTAINNQNYVNWCGLKIFLKNKKENVMDNIKTLSNENNLLATVSDNDLNNIYNNSFNFTKLIGIKCNFDIKNIKSSFSFDGKFIFCKLQKEFQRRMHTIFIKNNPCKFMNIYDTFFLIGLKLKVMFLKTNHANFNFVENILTEFINYTFRIVVRNKIHVEKEKIDLIGRKAFLNSGIWIIIENIKNKKILRS